MLMTIYYSNEHKYVHTYVHMGNGNEQHLFGKNLKLFDFF